MILDTEGSFEGSGLEYDAVIIGAGYAGLISGAILARHGAKVLVLDELDQVGGRGGAVLREGYWIDCAHRQATDLGDTYMLMSRSGRYGQRAAELCGADLALRGPIDPMMQVHLT